MMQKQSKLSQTIALIKRALFPGPRRVIGHDYTIPSFIVKIKNFVSRLSPSMWLLGGSILLLIYAIISTTNTQQNKTILTHNSATETNLSDNSNRIIQHINREQLVDTIITSIQDTDTTTISSPTEDLLHEEIAQETSPIQFIYDRYDAINNGSYIVDRYFDSYMSSSSFVQEYFTPQHTQRLIASTINGISISDAHIVPYDRADRVRIDYSISYTLRDSNQSFNEDRSVILRDQGGWKIGTIRCETRGCSTNPIFNPTSYGIR